MNARSSISFTAPASAGRHDAGRPGVHARRRAQIAVLTALLFVVAQLLASGHWHHRDSHDQSKAAHVACGHCHHGGHSVLPTATTAVLVLAAVNTQPEHIGASRVAHLTERCTRNRGPPSLLA